MRSAVETELEQELKQEFEQELRGGVGAEFEVIGIDTRRLVTNTRVAPFRYVCNLEYNGRPNCTGTLIGPSTVLTAGHCLSGRDPALMRVIPGRNGALEPLPATRAARFHLAPGFVSGSATDYGVIQLQHPIGAAVGHWHLDYRRTAIDPLGTSILSGSLPLRAGVLPVNLSGYPGDKCVQAGRPPQQLCGAQQWRAFNRTVRVSGGILEYVNDTFGGHSGSPVWVRRAADRGGRVLVAIHISGDDSSASSPVVANRGVLITPGVRANIRRWLAEAPVHRPRPIVMPPTVVTVLPFQVLDRFAHNSAALQPHHARQIDLVARHVLGRSRSRAPVRTVRLVGHADSTGQASFNAGLGRRRAAVVATRLRSDITRLNPGLAGRIRFVVQTLGETRPAAGNDTPVGRARNRRVQVFVSTV